MKWLYRSRFGLVLTVFVVSDFQVQDSKVIRLKVPAGSKVHDSKTKLKNLVPRSKVQYYQATELKIPGPMSKVQYYKAAELKILDPKSKHVQA